MADLCDAADLGRGFGKGHGLRCARADQAFGLRVLRQHCRGRGEARAEQGGKVVVALGPKWRIHYYAHLHSVEVYPGQPLLTGSVLGSVGDSGNARGKPAHLHYSIVSLLPLPWRADDSTQGWKKMFYLDPNQLLQPQ